MKINFDLSIIYIFYKRYEDGSINAKVVEKQQHNKQELIKKFGKEIQFKKNPEESSKQRGGHNNFT